MTAIKDLFLLISRLMLGGVLIAHGWQKYNDWTIDGTAQNFEEMGVPSPELSAQFATFFELAAGALLILGLLVRLVGPILFALMVGAAWFAHRQNGLFATDGGWELVAVIGAAGLALAAAGAGRISLDYLLAAPFRRRKEEKLEKQRAGRYEADRNQQFAGQPAAQPNDGQFMDGHANGDFGSNEQFGGHVDPNAPTTQWPGDTRGQ